jgi:glycosyltransferase involved in cell wall biosynthesis
MSAPTDNVARFGVPWVERSAGRREPGYRTGVIAAWRIHPIERARLLILYRFHALSSDLRHRSHDVRVMRSILNPLAGAVALNAAERSPPPRGDLQDKARRHLLHVLPSFAVGGIQVRLARVINSLGDSYRHSIIALDGNLACRDRIDPALDVAVTGRPGLPGSLAATLLACRAAMRRQDPDLLVTYNWGAIEWALANTLLRTCPHIHFEDGFGPEEAETQLRRRVWMRRLALSRTAAVVVPSRSLETLAAQQWRLPGRRLRHVPNGIDCDAFATAPGDAVPPLFPRRPDEVIIGSIAPLRPEKNLARLIRAFAGLPPALPARLVIAGEGTERDSLEALSRQLGLAERVVLLGAISEPQRMLAAIDLYALSSDTEQMPLTILEAMAAGRAVAAVDVGDVKLMLAPENGALVVAKRDEAALGAALLALVADPARRARLGALNRDHVRTTYPWQGMIEAYEQIFAAVARRCRIAQET